MRKSAYLLVLFSLLIPLSATSAPVETTIDDYATSAVAYWGGQVVNAGATQYGDVIGNPYFGVDQMVVTQDGNAWVVILSGEYFTYRTTSADNGLPARLLPGDLYISSTGWELSEGNHETDTFGPEEGWRYVIPIGTGTGETPTGVYALDYDGITETNVNGWTGYVYRTDQAWKGGAAGDPLGTASSLFSGNSLTITFDATDLDFSLGSVGFHWTMQCGNDVVRGLTPAYKIPTVPEPSSILLLGLGLTGVALYKKIRS